MIEDMTIRKFAPKTQHDYVQRVKNFTAFLGRSPDTEDRRAGKQPVEDGLLVYQRERVACVKRAFRRGGRELGIAGFSQKKFRPFMNDQARKLFAMVPRENRSRWLGHVVRDGSRTTDHYESDDPHALADVALATDCIMSLLAERCERPLFAIETRRAEGDRRSGDANSA
jgi:hypothetical protein